MKLRRQRVVTGDQALTEHQRAAAIAADQDITGRANRLPVYEVLRQQNRAPSIGSTYLRGARRTKHKARSSALAAGANRAARRADLSRTGWLTVWSDGGVIVGRKATAPKTRCHTSATGSL